MEVTIREETLDDELFALEAGLDGVRLNRAISLRRIFKTGPLENPGEEILRHLTRVDFDLVELALAKMDVELATAAGIVPAGRAEPDGKASGDP